MQQTIHEVQLPIKVFMQSDDSLCGAASIKMIADYYGFSYSEKDIANMCNHSYEKGCTNEDMQSAMQIIGLNPKILRNSSILKIEEEIKIGKPVIVDWFTGDPANGHSSVVIGFDKNNLIILDPLKEEPFIIDKEDFLVCWFDYKEVPISKDNLDIRVLITVNPQVGKPLTPFIPDDWKVK